ncbi:hypothetical protein Y032_0040g315 [Ancylostoma ceylanicum]|nr:hypothetical protein Y032_0040g315 [Ancylostoma ceylanicum]
MQADEKKFVTFQYGESRIGNQLFRLASGYGVARKLGRRFYFEVHRKKMFDMLDRITDAFPATAENIVIRIDPKLNAKNLTFRNSRLLVEYISNDTAAVVLPFADNKGKATCWKYEDPSRYSGHPAKYLLLNTYCAQNARFFEDYLPEIREMLRFSETLTKKTQEKLRSGKICFAKTTCLHTRQTDFLAHKRTTNLNETIDAALRISQRHGSEHYMIFGDDQKFMNGLARRLEIADGLTKKTVYVSSYNEFEDMHVSSQLCTSFLITNAMSTFGWWLAFFAPNQDAIYYMNDQRPQKAMNGIRPNELFLSTWKRFSQLD